MAASVMNLLGLVLVAIVLMILLAGGVFLLSRRLKTRSPRRGFKKASPLPNNDEFINELNPLVIDENTTDVPRVTQRMRLELMDRSAHQLSGIFGVMRSRATRPRRIRPEIRQRNPESRIPVMTPRAARRAGLRSQVFRITDEELLAKSGVFGYEELPTAQAPNPIYSFEATGFELPQNLNEFGATMSPGVGTSRIYSYGMRFGRASYQTTAGREFVERGTDIETDYDKPFGVDYEKYVDRPARPELDFELEYSDRPYTSFFTGLEGTGLSTFNGRLFEKTGNGRAFVINANGNGVHVVGEPGQEEEEETQPKGFDFYEDSEPLPEQEERLIPERTFNFTGSGLASYFTRSPEDKRRMRRLIRRNPFFPFQGLLRQRDRVQVMVVIIASMLILFFIGAGLALLSRQIDRAPADTLSILVAQFGEGEAYAGTAQARELSIALGNSMLAQNGGPGLDLRRTELIVRNRDQAQSEIERARVDMAVWGFQDPERLLRLQFLLKPDGPYEMGEAGRLELERNFYEPELVSFTFLPETNLFQRFVAVLGEYYRGNYDLAVAGFRELSRNLGTFDVPELHVLAGNANYLLRQNDAAVQEYDTALQMIRDRKNPSGLDPDQVTNNRAMVLSQRADRFNEANSLLLPLATNRTDQPRFAANYIYLQIERGNITSNQPQLMELANRLKTALATNPAYWPGQYYMAQAYLNLNDWTQAENLYRKTQQLKPEFALAYSGLGYTLHDRFIDYYAGTNTPEGLKLLESSRAQFQKSFDLANATRQRYAAHANALRQTQGREGLAPVMEDYSRKAGVEAEEARFGLTRDILERGRIEGNRVGNFFDQVLRWVRGEKTALEDARDRLQQIVNERKEYGPAYFYLGEAYYLLGDINNANSNYDLAKSKANPQVVYYSTVAAHLLKDNKRPEAVSQIREYITRYPNSAEGYTALADLYMKIGDPQSALREANEAIKRNNRDALAYLVAGKAYADLKQNKESATAFERAAQLDPGNTDITYERGVALYNDGQLSEALQVLRLVNQLRPGVYPQASFLIGKIQQEAYNNLSEAIFYYEQAVKQNDSLVSAWRQLATLYWQVNRLDDALTAYRKLVQSNPNDYESVYYLGLIQLNRKQTGEAERYFRDAIRLQPGFYSAYIQLSNLLAEKDDQAAQDEAIRLSQVATRLDASNPLGFNALGYVYYRRGLYQEAIRSYDSALRVNPNAPEVLYNKSIAHMSLQQYDLAQASLNQAIRFRPENSEYLLLMAQILEKNGKAAEAIEAYNRAIQSGLQNPAPAYLGIGNIYLSRGQIDVAQTNYSKAVAADPNLLDGYYQLASTYFLQGKLDQAITEFERVVKKQTDRGLAWFYLGVLYSRKSRVDEALNAFQNAVKFSPNRVEAHYELGNILRVKGQRQQALAEYDNALKLVPNYYPAHLQKGLVYESNEQFEEARLALQEALKSPDPLINQQARDALNRIRR
jgi:tetratricopeptide (TPR) repeat protein